MFVLSASSWIKFVYFVPVLGVNFATFKHGGLAFEGWRVVVVACRRSGYRAGCFTSTPILVCGV
jgi:hypothetical protein